MNYYPFHLGDYAAHTSHLEPLEDLAYRRMLDLYYLRESALPQEPAEVARLIRMRSNVAEVEAVLREFFTNNDGDGWVHVRCEAEISKMQDKQAKAKASAAASVKARSTNAQRTLNERSTDVELPTPTPTPTPTPSKEGDSRKRSPIIARPDGVDEQVWADWLQLRKAKKAPVTETVIKSATGEAAKAGMPLSAFLQIWCARGSQGLEASWLTQAEKNGKPVESFYERDQRLKAEEMAKWAPGIAKKPLNFANPFEYIDMETSNVIAIESH